MSALYIAAGFRQKVNRRLTKLETATKRGSELCYTSEGRDRVRGQNAGGCRAACDPAPWRIHSDACNCAGVAAVEKPRAHADTSTRSGCCCAALVRRQHFFHIFLAPGRPASVLTLS